jgi:hypothetical protein
MTRRTFVVVLAMLALLSGGALSSLPASASHPRDVSPQDVDPHLFALPASALPPPANACLSGTTSSSGQLTAATVTIAGTGTGTSIICGIISEYKAATAADAGTISVAGQVFPIAPGVQIAGIDQFTIVDHVGVSNNKDADGTVTPPDGFAAQVRIVHSANYEDLGRLDNGWREDMHYLLAGVVTESEYLVSVFPDAAHAQAAMDDATTKQFNILSIIAKPLPAPEQCTSGTSCKAYSGVRPGSNPAQEAIFTLFVRGPVLVETASVVLADKFDGVRSEVEASLYAMLISADNHIQQALNPSPPTPTDTPTATATPTSVATDTPIPTDTPTATPKPAKKVLKCKKGYKKVKKKGKQVCQKIKKKK